MTLKLTSGAASCGTLRGMISAMKGSLEECQPAPGHRRVDLPQES